MKTLQRPALVIGLLMAFVAASAFGQNSLAVTGAAALNGTNFGLAVTLDGSTNNVNVRDDSPAAEAVYRAAFWLDPNSLTMGAFDRTAVLSIRSPAFLEVIRVQLQYNGFSHRVRVACLNNAGVWKFGKLPNNFRFITIPDAPLEVVLEAEFLGGLAGNCSLSALGSELVTDPYNSNNYSANDARFGSKNPNATTSGTFYLDEFSSFRTLAP